MKDLLTMTALATTLLATSYPAFSQSGGGAGGGGTISGSRANNNTMNAESPGSNGVRSSGVDGSSDASLGTVRSSGVDGVSNSSSTTSTGSGMSGSRASNGVMPGNGAWESENNYWRNNYPSASYYNSTRSYSTYEPAYRYGVDLYNQNQGKSFDTLNQSQISSGWNNARGGSNLSWMDAQRATRDAYNRMSQNHSGSSGNATSTPRTNSGTM